jgi:hypothetical protein
MGLNWFLFVSQLGSGLTFGFLNFFLSFLSFFFFVSFFPLSLRGHIEGACVYTIEIPIVGVFPRQFTIAYRGVKITEAFIVFVDACLNGDGEVTRLGYRAEPFAHYPRYDGRLYCGVRRPPSRRGSIPPTAMAFQSLRPIDRAAIAAITRRHPRHGHTDDVASGLQPCGTAERGVSPTAAAAVDRWAGGRCRGDERVTSTRLQRCGTTNVRNFIVTSVTVLTQVHTYLVTTYGEIRPRLWSVARRE